MKTPAQFAVPESRKQLIARTALRLFADKGYEQVPTQLVAREAGVSEALIFKHFGTKEQLLLFIITTGYQRVAAHVRGRLVDDDQLVVGCIRHRRARFCGERTLDGAAR